MVRCLLVVTLYPPTNRANGNQAGSGPEGGIA